MSAESPRTRILEPGSSPPLAGSWEALPPALAYEVLDALPTSILVLDRDGTIVWMNRQARCPAEPDPTRSTAWHRVGASYFSESLMATAPDDDGALRAVSGILDVLRGRAPHFCSERRRSTPAGQRWIRTTVLALASRDGAVVTHEDITSRKALEAELDRSRLCWSQGQKTHDAEPAGGSGCARGGLREPDHVGNVAHRREAIAIADAARRIVMVNDAYSEITGFARAEIVGRRLAATHTEDGDSALDESIWHCVETTGKWQGQVRSRRKNGERFTALMRIDAVRDEQGMVSSYVSSSSDFDSIEGEENRLRYLAHHDSLTGLANRLLFWARLEQAMEHASRNGGQIAVLFVDLNRFKAINDSLGHSVGDEVLRITAQRLRAQVRSEDTVGRLGGDELGVILEEIVDPRDAIKVAEKLGAAIGETLEIEGQRLQISASIGIALYCRDGETPDSLLKAADKAMYEAKRSGQTVCTYVAPPAEQDMSPMARRQTAMQIALPTRDRLPSHTLQADG